MNILSNPTHVAHIGYNGFNMENVLKFSSTTGELLPVYYDFLQPGDKVSLQAFLHTRTNELESAAMCQLKEHLEWFFVPMNQLYSIFGDWFNGIQDLKSSLFDPQLLKATLPHYTPSYFSQVLQDLQVTDDAYFTSGYVPTGTSNPEPLIGTSFRLLELLGVPLRDYKGEEGDTTNFPMAYLPLLACAYQKIYYDYYRLSDREINDPKAYNLDLCYDDNLASGMAVNMFKLRYRPWARDFYTNVFSSPLFGSSGISSYSRDSQGASLELTKSFNQWLTATNFNTYSVGAWTASSATGANPSGRNEMSPNTYSPTQVAPDGISSTAGGSVTNPLIQFGNVQQALSPTSIRTSFAVQKLLEVTRRAGKHYDAQTLAHFGVKVPEGIAGEVTYIGGSVHELNIGEVIATAGTEIDPLGKIAGKGMTDRNQIASKTLKFEAKCHGVLMCIYSCEPVADYQANMYDKLNTLVNLADWPRPEMDNLGPQPLFGYQVYLQTNSTNLALNSNVYGWQYRWSEFKLKYNRVCGSLARSMHYWTPQKNDYTLYNAGGFYPSALNYHLISPSYLDDIMLVPYRFSAGGHPSDEELAQGEIGYNQMFESDPLFHQLYFDVKKASKMSTYGLESL